MTREEIKAILHDLGKEGKGLLFSDPKHSRSVLRSIIEDCRRECIDLLPSVLINLSHVNSDEKENKAILEEARDIAESFGDKVMLAKALGRLGTTVGSMGDLKEGIALMERAFSITQEPDYITERNDYLSFSIASNLVTDYQTLGAVEQISKYRAIVLRMFPTVYLPRPKAWGLYTLANTVARSGEYLSAIPIYEAALGFAREAKDLSAVSEFLGKLAIAYKNCGRTDEAENLFIESIEIAREIEESLGIGSALHRYGGFLRQTQRLDKAESTLREALEALRGKHRHEYLQVQYELGRLCLKQGDLKHAQEYLSEVEIGFLSIGIKSDLPELYGALSELYHAEGDTDKAFDYLTRKVLVVDEIFNAEAKRSLSSVQILLAIEHEKHETEMEKLKTAQLERDVSSATLHLLAQTELLSDLRKDLLQIAKRIPPTEPAARELRERVKNLPCQSIDWEKFDAQFKAAHPEFVKKLLERYPELTPMETRVCTLLRMNLKSHEIAKMFCLEERSIETHRFNIRKKLKLETKQSLSNFLNAL